MTELDALTVARSRAVVMAELRRLLPRVENLPTALPFGLAALDSHLPQGGLVRGGLHEVVPEQGATPAAFGFMAAILSRLYSPPPYGEGLGVGVRRLGKSVDAPVSPRDPPPFPPPQGGREKIVFVAPRYEVRELGRLYGYGLNVFGLDPARLILVETTHRKNTLWALEEALHSGAPAAVTGVIDQLELKLSQRLQLAATAASLPLLLLRPARNLESSAAATRWRVGTAKAARDRFGLFARSRWHLQLERCRNGRPGEWMVEYDHVAHRFSLAAAMADPALSHSTGEKSFRRAG